jgi:hypothetical protein
MKWLELLENAGLETEGTNLLEAMEMIEYETGHRDDNMEDKEEISVEMVAVIEAARNAPQEIGTDDRKSLHTEKWGPTLVERQRRTHNGDIPVMQRTMEIKKRNNLEPLKGNAFATLNPDNLKLITKDVNLKFGKDSVESDFIIQNLIDDEEVKFKKFVNENPETLLPTNLDVENDILIEPVNGEVEQNHVITHVCSHIKTDTPSMWTEVVRRDKNKSKPSKISINDRRILE